MTHCSDDDLVLHYYGEPSDAESHLRELIRDAVVLREGENR